MIHLFQINDKQTGFGLQLQLNQIKVFPLQNQIFRMAVTCVFIILFWDGLCILAHIFDIGQLLLIDQDHEGERQGGDAGEG